MYPEVYERTLDNGNFSIDKREGVFLILTDFNVKSNIYVAGTLTNLIPNNSPTDCYIRYNNEDDLKKNIYDDLEQLSCHRNDVDFYKFKQYISVEELDRLLNNQKIKTKTVAYLNRLVTREGCIAVAVIETGGSFYGIRKVYGTGMDSDKAPKALLNYLYLKLNSKGISFVVDDINIGYETTQNSLIEHTNTYYHYPGRIDKYYYQFGIINQFLITGKKLIPIKEIK